MANVIERVKQSPVISGVILLGSIAAAVVAILGLTGRLDAMVVSEPELSAVLTEHALEPHAAAQQQINDARNQSSCESIDIRIAIVEDQIYRMEQDDPGAQRLVDKRRELRNLESKRRTLSCSKYN